MCIALKSPGATLSPAAHHSVVFYAAELPLLELVWVVGTILMESEINWSFCREYSFQREGDEKKPWEAARKAEFCFDIQNPLQEPRKLLTPGFPAISYSSKNQQIIKIPLRWLKIKWKDKQTDCDSVSPPLCPLSAHNQSILGECQKGQVSSLSLLPLPWSFRIPFSALLELCSCALWLVRGIG